MSKSIDKLAEENPSEWIKWNQTDPSVKPEANCPSPSPNPSDVANNIANTLDAAGIQACSTDQESTQFSAQMQGSIMGLMQGNASVQASTNKTATVGCEQVSAISNAYKQTVNNITCTIKNNSNNIANSQNAVNAILIDAGKDIYIDCRGCTNPETCADSKEGGGGLSFNQSINMKMVSSIQLSTNDVKSIANNTSAVCQGIAKVAMDSTNGLGATPQGQKSIQTATNTISQQNFNEAVTNAVNNIKVSQNADNTITIKAGGTIRIVGKQCTFNQDTVLDIVANAIISDVVQTTMQNVATAINTNDNEVSQKAVNKGAEDLIKVAAPDQTSNPLYGLGGTAQMLMIGAIVLGVLGVIGVGMKGAGASSLTTAGGAGLAGASSLATAGGAGFAGALATNSGVLNAVSSGAMGNVASVPSMTQLTKGAQNVQVEGSTSSAPSAPPAQSTSSTPSTPSGKASFGFKAVKCIPMGGWIAIAFAIILIIGVCVSLYLK